MPAFEKDYTRRQIIPQEFTAYALAVPAANAVPISQGMLSSSIQLLYEVVEICVPAAAAANVWFGGSNIVPASVNGIEIVAGSSRLMRINNERQLYELQAPLVEMKCGGMLDIQFKVWDPSNMFLRSAAGTITVGIVLYRGNFF